MAPAPGGGGPEPEPSVMARGAGSLRARLLGAGGLSSRASLGPSTLRWSLYCWKTCAARLWSLYCLEELQHLGDAPRVHVGD
eukprot:686555-Alexandrium_andersonii.AAC.1